MDPPLPIFQENRKGMVSTWWFSYSKFLESSDCRISLDSVLKGFKIEYLKIRLEIENKDNFIKLIKDKI